MFKGREIMFNLKKLMDKGGFFQKLFGGTSEESQPIKQNRPITQNRPIIQNQSVVQSQLITQSREIDENQPKGDKTDYNIPESVKMSLDMALENNQLVHYLFSIGLYEYNFKINVRNIGPTIDYRLLLFSIYDKYKKDPSIYNIFVQTLNNLATNCKNGGYANYMLDILSWQLTLEKHGYAPFKVDVQDILNKFRVNIDKNKEHYTKLDPEGCKSFIDDFREKDSDFQKYGCKLF